jgi:hypothetical protein
LHDLSDDDLDKLYLWKSARSQRRCCYDGRLLSVDSLDARHEG